MAPALMKFFAWSAFAIGVVLTLLWLLGSVTTTGFGLESILGMLLLLGVCLLFWSVLLYLGRQMEQPPRQ